MTINGTSCLKVHLAAPSTKNGSQVWREEMKHKSSKPWTFESGVEGRDGCAKRKEMCGIWTIWEKRAVQ